MTDKATLRRLAAERRRSLVVPGFAEALAGFAGALALPPDAVVAGYVAFRDEADPAALFAALGVQGHRLCLPVVVGRTAPLRFHRWQPGEALIAHAYGMLEPSPAAPVVVPDVLLVPLLAFDDAGYRLGYGGGFYDRTLASLRAIKPVTAIGIAYAGQAMPALEIEEHDAPLDAILTEQGLRAFGG